MFNFKKYVSAADLSTKVSPEDIPGRTIEEKAAYISEFLDREIGEKLAVIYQNFFGHYHRHADVFFLHVGNYFFEYYNRFGI